MNIVEYFKRLFTARKRQREYKRLLAQALVAPRTTEGQAYQAFCEGELTLEEYTSIFNATRNGLVQVHGKNYPKSLM